MFKTNLDIWGWKSTLSLNLWCLMERVFSFRIYRFFENIILFENNIFTRIIHFLYGFILLSLNFSGAYESKFNWTNMFYVAERCVDFWD